MDIGANIGTTSIYASKKHNGMRYIAFEPDDINFQCLKANIELNNCNNIMAYNYAVSNFEGSAEMLINEKNRGGTRIVNEESFDDTDINLEQVRVTAIDHFLRNMNIDYKDVKMVWIDVEGHEPFAINGMMDLLRNAHPCMYMELTPKRSGIVGESDFDLMFSNITQVYDRVIVPDIKKGAKPINKSIGFVKTLYAKSNRQYNLFLYRSEV